MRTDFPAERLAEPAMAASEAVIRKCVHCGFCTATCPTYVLLGDELDSPRGRIYLIKDMLERDRDPTPEIVKHVDRCLSCLACMTTCPSGVNYMHLVDHARAYIAQRYRRRWLERMYRTVLAGVLPYPRRFRVALRVARWVRFAGPALQGWAMLRPAAAMLALAPRRLPGRVGAVREAVPARSVGRVALLGGCAEAVLRPEFRAAAARVLGRAGYAVVSIAGEGCCGALVHHLGREAASLEAARRNVDAWTREIEGGGLAAIVVTASGCGTAIKDYGFLLRGDPAYAAKAAAVSALARDISEFLAPLAPVAGDGRGLTVAYHAACSLQHGQGVTEAPVRLLRAAGYAVVTPAEAHLCCGSAGTYNILQPVIAEQLGARKAAHIAALGADVVAAGNVGCAVQIGRWLATPVVHVVELVDWATGGPRPAALAGLLAEGGGR